MRANFAGFSDKVICTPPVHFGAPLPSEVVLFIEDFVNICQYIPPRKPLLPLYCMYKTTTFWYRKLCVSGCTAAGDVL